jgi:DNA mismatch repair protein MutS2
MRRTNEECKIEFDQAIDYDKVLQQIAGHASFSCSRDAILSAMPLDSHDEIQQALELVKEGMELERKAVYVNFTGCSDIRDAVVRARKEMVLSGPELNAVRLFLNACQSVPRTLNESEAPHLNELSQSMDLCRPLVRSIQEQIDAAGMVKDDASPLLLNKHREYNDVRMHLQTTARDFIKSHSQQLMETVTTTIQGRLCVLVRAQDKNTFGGMVHGSSQSGQAFYAEPRSFVTYNNRLQNINDEIEAEKHRICKELSVKVRKNALALLSDLETMTYLDEAMAKARWAYEKDGCVPLMENNRRKLYMEAARHPLLDPENVVANTYTLNESQYCMMISGPNMGGKTVTLKTIGLFVTLAHAGFPVLCHTAHIPFYESLWFVIGDNQSIENNLSTFSAHISKIARICDNCDRNSFVLLDELGSGTDPAEGAGLAVAILEYLMDRECTVLTSTHYHQVKSFGQTDARILVASMEFNAETLHPTYRFIPGVSGASYAFDIAAQYHLKESILKRAYAFKEENARQSEKEIEHLEQMQNEVHEQKERFRALIEDAHRVQREAQAKKEAMDAKKRDMDENYARELDEMLEEKRNEADAIVRTLRKQKNTKFHEQTEKIHELNALAEPIPEEPAETPKLKVGDYVQLDGLNSHGEITDIRKQEATVSVNGMKMKVKMNRLKKIQRPNVQKKKTELHLLSSKKRMPLELNLIGMHVDEGLRALDDYIDQAVANHVSQVRIVHGMGTGKLRQAVWDDLHHQPAVKEITAAGPNDGGLGATIVTLK